jgi:hypothetical protein
VALRGVLLTGAELLPFLGRHRTSPQHATSSVPTRRYLIAMVSQRAMSVCAVIRNYFSAVRRCRASFLVGARHALRAALGEHLPQVHRAGQRTAAHRCPPSRRAPCATTAWRSWRRGAGRPRATLLSLRSPHPTPRSAVADAALASRAAPRRSRLPPRAAGGRGRAAVHHGSREGSRTIVVYCC